MAEDTVDVAHIVVGCLRPSFEACPAPVGATSDFLSVCSGPLSHLGCTTSTWLLEDDWHFPTRSAAGRRSTRSCAYFGGVCTGR